MDPLYRAGDKFKITKKQQYIYGVYIKDKYELITLTIRKLGGDVMGNGASGKGRLRKASGASEYGEVGDAGVCGRAYADVQPQVSGRGYVPAL